MPTQLEACQGACQAKKGPAGSSLGGQPQPQGSDVLPGQESVSEGPGRQGTQLYTVTCPHKAPALRGTWAPGSQGVCRVLGSGTQGVHGQGKPKPSAQDPHRPAADNSGPYRRLGAQTSSAVPRWPTPRRPVEKFAGASQTHTTQEAPERTAGSSLAVEMCLQ